MQRLLSLLVVVVLSLGLAACHRGGGASATNNVPASGASPQLNWDQGNWNEKNWQ